MTVLVDSYGRSVSYMRLSITDRCNLRCFYCQGGCEFVPIPHEQILTYEEILRLMGMARDLDVRKVRLTGGEPLVRKDFMQFLERAVTNYPDLDLRITTNGVLLPGKAQTLADMGVKRLNISLDTMDPATFQRLTEVDAYHKVRQAIDECLEIGMRVKINCVALRNINDKELPQFIEMARNNPLDVRFIEFMPVGGKTIWEEQHYWSAEDILTSAGELCELEPLGPASTTSGPARVFTIKGGAGRLGVISPLSNHFCHTCNRLRVTCDGRLRTCLFSDNEYRLRPLLRHPKLGDAQVLKVLEKAQERKPLGFELLAEKRQQVSVCSKVMSAIGG